MVNNKFQNQASFLFNINKLKLFGYNVRFLFPKWKIRLIVYNSYSCF